jgi:hypothetical protein
MSDFNNTGATYGAGQPGYNSGNNLPAGHENTPGREGVADKIANAIPGKSASGATSTHAPKRAQADWPSCPVLSSLLPVPTELRPHHRSSWLYARKQQPFRP